MIGDTDVGGIALPLTQKIPDVVTFPFFNTPTVPGYNVSLMSSSLEGKWGFPNFVFWQVPELFDLPPMILNFTIIADIYLNKITHWNDTAIKELNPHLAAFLPDKPIIVLYGPALYVTSSFWTQAIAATVPEFNTTVCNASLSPQQFVFEWESAKCLILLSLSTRLAKDPKLIFQCNIHPEQ